MLDHLTKKLCFIVIGLTSIIFADLIIVDAVITADNHYAIYYGNETDGLTYVGMNEKNSWGSNGKNNWNHAETWNFDMSEDDYIYIAAWDDQMVAKALIGEFTFNQSEIIYTNTEDWLTKSGDRILSDGSDPLLAEEMNGLISGGWNKIDNSKNHGVLPWGKIGGISLDANWIWGDKDDSNFHIFKLNSVSVPEPATIGFLFSGLICLPFFSFIRRKKD